MVEDIPPSITCSISWETLFAKCDHALAVTVAASLQWCLSSGRQRPQNVSERKLLHALTLYPDSLTAQKSLGQFDLFPVKLNCSYHD